MKRRDFLKASALASAAGCLPLASGKADAIGLIFDSQYRKTIPEIFLPPPVPRQHSRAIVIGSGFGGAVSALRLGQAGVQTTVLEQGMRWPVSERRETFATDLFPDGRAFWFRDKAKFLSVLLPKKIKRFAGVMDTFEGEHIDVYRGMAVGGGSVVYTGVMIEPRREHFDAIYGGLVSYDEMAMLHYPKVRQLMRLSVMPNDIYASAPFVHSREWDNQLRQAGFQPRPLESVFNWQTVRAELANAKRRSAIAGESNFGNSNGAKFDLTQNYIPMAEATGNVVVHPGHQVMGITRHGTGFAIDVRCIDPFGQERYRRTITCDYLFMAAGTVGTSQLLVRARDTGQLPTLNEHIGEGFGSNGNAFVTRSFGRGGLRAQPSPCASGVHIDDGRTHLPTTVENWYVPGVPIDIGAYATLSLSFDQANRGRFVYNRTKDVVELKFPASAASDTAHAARTINNRICDANRMVPGVPLFFKDVRTDLTAHPLGGCVIGKGADTYGRVLETPGLFVMDGALIPGTAGAVNPSLTIAALAERNIAEIIRTDIR